MTEPKADVNMVVNKNKLAIALVAAVALGFALGILYPIAVAALFV